MKLFDPKVGDGSILAYLDPEEPLNHFKLFTPDSQIRDVIEWAWKKHRERIPGPVTILFGATKIMLNGLDGDEIPQ